VSDPAITIRNVSKRYRRYAHRRQFSTLKSALLTGSLTSALNPDEVFLAVSELSLAVPKGISLGVIGRNGSGKSTLLKLIAGITKPTTGTIKVAGRVSALIELGAGFHPEISGRENVFINGVMLGLSKREITRRFDEIVEFAELEEFIDAPVKTYSSGMYMRLGFAVAVNVNPDVLLVDEVLAVGDEGFSLKCLDKFSEFKRRGKTIVLVTHGLGMVEHFCDEAIWIDGGKLKSKGDPRRVVHSYTSDVQKREEHVLSSADQKLQAAVSGPTQSEPEHSADQSVMRESPPEDMFRAAQGRWGSGPVRIDRVVLERNGKVTHIFQSGDQLAIKLSVSTERPVKDFVFGISIFNPDGICCYGTNTDIEDFLPLEMIGEGQVVFVVENLDLVEGTYKIDVAAHTRQGVQYDYHRLLYTFRVKSGIKDTGIFRPRHRWTFSPNVRFA